MRLYINIDHVATVRQARRTDEPDPVAAALARRARRRRRNHGPPPRGSPPHPGRRRPATGGGRDHRAQPGAGHQRGHRGARLRPPALPGHHRARAARGGDHRGRARPRPPRPAPDRDHPPPHRRRHPGQPLHRSRRRARSRPRKALGVPAIELHTGDYAHNWRRDDARARRLCGARPPRAQASASRSTPATASPTSTSQPVAAIPEIEELNIGHSIVSRAVLDGMEPAVRAMAALVAAARS